MNTENRIYKILRKAKLANRHEGSLGCTYCRPHRNENAGRAPRRSWKFRSHSRRQWQPKPFGYYIEKGQGWRDGEWRGMYGDNFICWLGSERTAMAWLARHSKRRANSRSNKNLSQNKVENKSGA